MYLTIGFTARHLRISQHGDLAQWMCDCAASHGMGFSFGQEKAVEEIRPGLASLAQSLDTDFFALLHAPKEETIPVADGVGIAIEEGAADEFFQFLIALWPRLEKLVDPSVFFALGWEATERARYGQGLMEDLIQRLRSPWNWTDPLYDPRSDSIWNDDESPFFFNLGRRL